MRPVSALADKIEILIFTQLEYDEKQIFRFLN